MIPPVVEPRALDQPAPEPPAEERPRVAYEWAQAFQASWKESGIKPVDMAAYLEFDGDKHGLLAEIDRVKPQRLVIDYAVHHVKADGRLSPKVFKGKSLMLRPGETLTLSKRHALRPITTRVYHAGLHRLEILVNGVSVASADFRLDLPRPEGP